MTKKKKKESIGGVKEETSFFACESRRYGNICGQQIDRGRFPSCPHFRHLVTDSLCVEGFLMTHSAE